jgi:hypothetical protein
MADLDTCLVVTAETWFAMIDRALTPGINQLQEYKVRCRIVVAGAEVLMVHPYELAEGSGPFRRLDSWPELRKVARFKIIREEPWERSAS